MVRRLTLAGCIALGLGLLAPAAWAVPAAEPPRRVVSMNLCTDQLAMMLAAPGQLISVSYLARDARSSAMADEAALYPVNHGLAEEIAALRPDLVLAGSYTTPATVAMLRRLQIPVEQFAPEDDFEAIRANIRKMGAALGRAPEAEAMIAVFDRDLAALQDSAPTRPRAALYGANGYTSGDQSLAGQIIAAAGLDNIATEAGLSQGGILSLEQLVRANPDLLIRGQGFGGGSRAEDILDHPAVQDLAARAGVTAMADPDWVCGTPHVLAAIAKLRAARLAVQKEQKESP
ncbi:ABC transporter substrate-binding protein [Paracoccus aminophilus]|uniref:ABC cobalamin/Fe3+-siderophore transporter, periplasmic substrate-binding subunit n=1 Tax=Paracoccus aminophilus JCM 7686 TaxID=1367847 RepID=S5YJ18_PARAH|nr:ABC transporter substrate-binding protein [Paracoccus aminophilus]AGT11463.1 ABC cobalamin/Fe3+-siderophore transporter, periplasmic substrate-binding subunit [Paracoccus aminophilus JCM 7686]